MNTTPSNLPLISVILPIFNGVAHMSQSIESILSQSHTHLELIIIDDASTDDSYALASQYAENDTRIRLERNHTNLGLPKTLNRGHALAGGMYITWTSDDNTYEQEALQILLKQLEVKKVDFVYAHCTVIDGSGKETGFLKAKAPANLLFRNVVGACFLYRREVFENNGGYDASLVYVEDLDFWLKTVHSSTMAVVDKTIYAYRFHKSNLTAAIQNHSEKAIVFRKNKESMLIKFFASLGIKDAEATVAYFLGFHMNSPLPMEALYNPTIYQQVSRVEKEARSLAPGSLTHLLSEVIVNHIFAHKPYQKFSILLMLLQRDPAVIYRLPAKRFLALVKKCLF